MIKAGDVANFVIIAFAVVVILVLGRPLLIPLVIAMLLWFIIKQIRFSLDKVGIIKRRIPGWIKYFVSFLVIVGILNFVVIIVYSNFRHLLETYSKYQENLTRLIHSINDRLNIDLMSHLQVYMQDFEMGTLIFTAFNLSTLLLSNLTMVIVYAVFLFLEEPAFRLKLKRLFPEGEQFDNAFGTLKRIEYSVGRYLAVKTMISFVTATLGYIVFELVGVDFPVFWAFLIFVLNFIPALGSIVATLLPVAFSMLQFGDYMPGLILLFSVGAIQFFIGNILDPKIMGDNVNLSPLIIILSLAFWGSIWGITGAILSVPVTVVMVIILSKFPKTQPIAIVLSGKGEVG